MFLGRNLVRPLLRQRSWRAMRTRYANMTAFAKTTRRRGSPRPVIKGRTTVEANPSKVKPDLNDVAKRKIEQDETGGASPK